MRGEDKSKKEKEKKKNEKRLKTNLTMPVRWNKRTKTKGGKGRRQEASERE